MTHNAEKDVPVLTEGGYPTDEGLDFLRTFTGTARQLVDHLEEAMRAYGGVWVERITDEYDRPVRKVNMATGGWSGNEEIISHLQRSFFWFAYWESSRRGGAFTFHVPEDRWDEPMIEWPPAHVFPPGGIAAKVEASSLGTPEAKALRSTVSNEQAARVVARAKEIERERTRPIPPANGEVS